MGDPKDVILSTIRILRSRRVRPSDGKIAWFAKKHFLQPEDITNVTLEELVECGDILQVEYKGGISFRVAPHKLKANSKIIFPPAKLKFAPTPTDILRPLISAIAACGSCATKDRITAQLSANKQGHLAERLDTLLQKEVRVGVIGKKSISLSGRLVTAYYIARNPPLAMITKKVTVPSPANTVNHTVNNAKEVMEEGTSQKKIHAPFEHLQLHLKRLQEEKQVSKESEIADGHQVVEVTAGNLQHEPSSAEGVHEFRIKQENEYRRLLLDNPDAVIDLEKPISRRGRPRKPPIIYEDLSAFTSKRGRPPKIPSRGRSIKRARKVYDPSDGSARRRCPTVPAETPTLGSRCDVCCLQNQNHNVMEELLNCHRCSARAHPSCLGYSSELAGRSRLGPWTCMDCKHCAICNMDHNIGTLIFCDECDRAYHLTCHQPPLDEQPQGSWICFSCAPNNGQNVYECLPGLPTPRDSPVPDEESRGSSGSWEHAIFDPRIPNASSWTVNNVVEYMGEKGFEEYANVFKEQDIDGTALLMLTRQDVLTGLDLKLGPALKIYKHVRILQTRLPNPPLP